MLSKQADKQAFIFLKDVSFPDLRALVDYMYKGEVNVAQEQLASFLQTAEALDIKGMTLRAGSNIFSTRYMQIFFFLQDWHTKKVINPNSNLVKMQGLLLLREH